MAATALWPPGCACVARAGPPTLSPTFATWRLQHDQAPSSGGGELSVARLRPHHAILHASLHRASFGTVDRVRPEQLRAECLDRGAGAAADQPPDYCAAKSSADADQPGAQSREPAIFFAATASILDPAHATASRASAEHHFQHSTDRSRVPDDLWRR